MADLDKRRGGGTIDQRAGMRTIRYVHWQEEDFHLGYLEDYPDYLTQGTDLNELIGNLKDLFADLSSGSVPYARKVDELVIS